MRTPILIPVLALLAAAPNALAGQHPAPAATGSASAVDAKLAQGVGHGASKLTRIREENLILKAELTGATLRSKIRQAEGKFGSASGPAPGMGSGLSPNPQADGTHSATGEALSSPSTHSNQAPSAHSGSNKNLYSKAFPAPGVASNGSGTGAGKAGHLTHAHHTPPTGQQSEPAAAPSVPSNLPVVLAVWTLGKVQSAAIRMSDGGQINVSVGDSLPDGGKVMKVSTRGVKVGFGGASRWLPYAKESDSLRDQQPVTLPPLRGSGGAGSDYQETIGDQ